MIDRKSTKDHTHYANLIIFVCNYPDERYLKPKDAKIIQALKDKWSITQDDRNCERVHIIYLSKSDLPGDDKFAPLKQVCRYSKIYVVGHSRAGADEIASDMFVARDSSLYRDKFSYADIGGLLLKSIEDPEIVIDRQSIENIDSIHPITATNRKLKISFKACETAVDTQSITGKIIEKSFAEKFASFVYNEFSHILVCDITGTNSIMAPIATTPDIDNVIRFILDKDTDAGFHVRYLRLPYQHGQFNFDISSWGFSHKPGRDYKLTFVPRDQTTYEDALTGNISFSRLDVPQANLRSQIQQQGENALLITNNILANEHLAPLHNFSAVLKFGLLSGTYNKSKIRKHADGLLARAEAIEKQKNLSKI